MTTRRNVIMHIDYQLLAAALKFPEGAEIVLMVPADGQYLELNRATMMLQGPMFDELDVVAPLPEYTAVYKTGEDGVARFVKFEAVPDEAYRHLASDAKEKS